MKLKNVLIVADDMEKSVRFYKDIFGLQVVMRQEGHVILSEGLVLQEAKLWADVVKGTIIPYNNMTQLYFEDNDIEGLIAKLNCADFNVKLVTEGIELIGEQKLVRLYDPSGNLIEVRTPPGERIRSWRG